MLGMKIAATGALAMVFAGVFISAIGTPASRMIVTVPLLSLFFGGFAAIVFGILWQVWA